MLSDGALKGRVSVIPSIGIDRVVSACYMPFAHTCEHAQALSHLVNGGRVEGLPSEVFKTLQVVQPAGFAATPMLLNTLHAHFRFSVVAMLTSSPVVSRADVEKQVLVDMQDMFGVARD